MSSGEKKLPDLPAEIVVAVLSIFGGAFAVLGFLAFQGGPKLTEVFAIVSLLFAAVIIVQVFAIQKLKKQLAECKANQFSKEV